MRKANERPLDSGIYARLRDVQMSEADRHDAAMALRQAEQIADAFLWVKEKFADLGHSFMKPSLRH
jgi:hypothetical protein